MIGAVLPILGSLDASKSVLCGVHSASHGLQGAENVVGLPSRGTIVAGNGSWKRAELVDGEDEDEVSKKRIREGIVRLSVHVGIEEGRTEAKAEAKRPKRRGKVARARGKVDRQPRQPHDLPRPLPEIPKRTAFSVQYRSL